MARAAAEETLEKNVESLRHKIGQLAARVSALKAQHASLQSTELAAAAADVERARRDAVSLRSRMERDLDERQAAETTAALELLRRTAEELAPGAAAAAWGDFRPDQPGTLSRHVRVGSVDVAGAAQAALAPLLGRAGWYVSGPRTMVDDLICAALTRVVAQAPLKKVRVTVFDPRARGVMGKFSPLRQAAASSFPTPTGDPRTLSETLTAVLQSVSHDTEVVSALTSGDLVDLWRTGISTEGTLQLVVVLDYPCAVDEAVQQQLIRIASTQGPVRPVLLVGVDTDEAAPRGVVPAELARMLVPLTAGADGWQLPGYGDLRASHDGPPPDPLLAAVISTASDRARSDTGPTIALTELLAADLADPWTHDSTDALDVVFGRAGRGLLELSLRTENPPHPNMLVGGMVGTGKSNLLLDIIYGLATRYSPDEFELHLLDFKNGLEFARFAPDAQGDHWLPHVRTLGLESDRAFGVAVLRWFLDELERRSALFKEAGASGIVGYRRTTGRPVPRLLLIIDEFHELFGGSEAEADASVEALERLAKQGRVYGVHLLLASQTTSGLAALAIKGDAIFAQFPIRLSLKNTVAESEAILSRGNKAAADLTYRGEVVLNLNAGHAPETSNQVGVAALADDDDMRALQARLWAKGHASPPLVFLGKEPAPWPDREPVTKRSGLEIWLGRPIAVGDVPRTHEVSEDADQAIAVLGQSRSAGHGPRDVLRTLVLTAAPSMGGGHVVVLDGDGDEADAWCADLEARLGEHDVRLVRLAADEAAAWLTRELKPRLAERGAVAPLLVVGLSVQRLRDLAVEEPPEDGDFSLEDRSARAVLQDLAHRGAQAKVFFFGSWNTLRTMETDLGSYGSGVALFLTVDLGLEDLRAIVGPMAQRVDGAPRVGVFERARGDALDVVVPYVTTGAPGRNA